MTPPTTRPRLFTRGSWPEASRMAEVLRAEATGGLLLIVAAATAIVWANSPWRSAYDGLRDLQVGPGSLHLSLSLAEWSAEGLLAIFFFVAGLELKREFVAGDLRNPHRAALPVAAAIGGIVAPAVIYTLVNATADDGAPAGWAIPTATDIAFALAILAVISTHLPTALRTFLLTLAVVDDLLGITVIAVFYTDELHVGWLLLALLPLAAFGFLVRRRLHTPWLLILIALLAWALVHAGGVQATVAGVVLGFTVPVHRRDGAADRAGLADQLEHAVRPVSTGLAVPVFAFFAAGVTLGGWDGITTALRDPVTLGVLAGLVVGKTVGIAGSTWLLHTFTRADLDEKLSWWDVLGMAMLAGVGFTVSLLIGELAFGIGSVRDGQVKVGVLLGSVLAATLATVVLRTRNRVYRRIEASEPKDADRYRVPVVFEGDRDR